MNIPLNRLKFILFSAAALLGLLQAWANRFYIEPDGLNYLDISYAYLHHDWPNAINAYWSPLYSWLLAAAIAFTRIPLPLESTLLHAVNFLLYLLALACFTFFFDELTRWRAESSSSQSVSVVDRPSWLIFGYTLFAYCELELIGLGTDTPDIIVSGFIFLATALLLRMRRGEPSWLLYSTFGLILALDYFAKMVMFPLAFVFLFCAFFAGKPGSARALRIASALAVFLLVSAPWLFALSHQKHRFTFGDTGKLSYVMYVNGIVNPPHWHGEDPLTGVPLHSTRRIHESPPADEFATPIAGSYPP